MAIGSIKTTGRAGSLTASVLHSWPFLLALTVLIANDGYLKPAFPGWLTGKLSDVAGVYLVALLVTALVPGKKRLGGAIVVLAFLYWKSPASQWLIDSLNAVLPAPIGRVVDYTDLLALATIPLAWITVSRRAAAARGTSLSRCLAIPVALVTALAVSATSLLLPVGEYSIRNADRENPVAAAAFVAAIERVTGRYGLRCANCEAQTDEVFYLNDDMDFLYALDDSINGVRFRIRVTKMKGILLPRPDYDLYDRFLRDLKQELGRLSPSMELVQSLSGPPNHE